MVVEDVEDDVLDVELDELVELDVELDVVVVVLVVVVVTSAASIGLSMPRFAYKPIEMLISASFETFTFVNS